MLTINSWVWIFLYSVASCNSVGAQPNLQEQFISFFFCELSCTQEPTIPCDSGICLRVTLNPTKSPPCDFECGEISKNPSNTTAINPTDNTNFSDVNNVTSVEQLGSTLSPNMTSSLVSTDDLSSCGGNLRCFNGGICSFGFDNLTGSYSANCKCLDGFVGTLCEEKCSLECPLNITCDIVDGIETCPCPLGTVPPDCTPEAELYRPPPPFLDQPIWFIPVIAVFALLALTLSAYFILLKLRWRSLLVTKIFHFLQPFEDDDGKIFDAFISFKSSKADYSQSEDEQFVIQTLQPKLEKELHYKVCVHYRDFQPGETINNNILWAVENSRRTILVLSPLYVQSEWARLEYQKAQQEMLSLRHKIIPIILEDISDVKIEDPNLKHILSSVTYIQYPMESDSSTDASKRFWTMLQLALPKIKRTDREMNLASKANASDNWRGNLKSNSFSKRITNKEEPENDQSAKNHSTTGIKSEGVVIDINSMDGLNLPVLK